MWPINEIFTFNMLSSFVGLFYGSDYSSDVVIQFNINVLERKVSAQSFEFSVVAMEMANAVAQNRFSDKFFFGAASSAYQTEGAYDSPEKGVSVWDYWTHVDPNLVMDNSNGDIACNSFYRYAEDIALVQNLGANSYRISLSWSRILPTGLTNYVSLEGIRYYNELINTMVLSGITPLVTIHQFDIPYKLQMMGGWTNPKMVEYFENYARIAYTYFGDRVKHWITINDPWDLCNLQFGDSLRPIFNDTAYGNYLCGHHVLLAHAKAYYVYHNEFEWLQKGKVGISIGTRWFEPEDYTSPEDYEAAEISYQFSNNWFLNPLLGELGDYPEIMKLEIGVKSAAQFFKTSRLPTFTPEQIDFVKYSLDFLGVSFFTTYSVRARDDASILDAGSVIRHASLESDMSSMWFPFNEAYGAFDVKNTAENFGKLLRRINSDYVLPKVYITANGYPDFGEVYDLDRAVYHYDHITELFESMKSGVDVRGYFAWSLMDSFEWIDGYTKHFGLYGVDFDNESRPRYEKLSTNVIKSIYETRTVPQYTMPVVA